MNNNVGKVGLALFLMGFWVFLPIPLQWFGITGFNIIEPTGISTPSDEGLGFFTWLAPITQGLSIYFDILFFNIPNIFPLMKYFLNFLQLSTVLFIIIMLRGN